MKTILLSNKITPHQLPCCIAFKEKTEFTFSARFLCYSATEGWKTMLQILGETIQGWTFAFAAPKSGSVVPCDDVDALEAEIQRVCTEQPYTQEACRKRAQAFDRDERFGDYVRLYEEE